MNEILHRLTLQIPNEILSFKHFQLLQDLCTNRISNMLIISTIYNVYLTYISYIFTYQTHDLYVEQTYL